MGSGSGLKVGRQAAWRPGFNRDGVVKFVGGTVLAVAVFTSDCKETWALTAGSNSVVKLLGGRVSILDGDRQVGWRHRASSCCV